MAWAYFGVLGATCSEGLMAIGGGEGGFMSSGSGCLLDIAAKGPGTLALSRACFLPGETSSEPAKLPAGRALLLVEFLFCSTCAI